MTENKNEQGSEPGRPAWAAGLDLSAEMTRASDRRLELTAAMRASAAPILRRLADAEMRVAQLERENAELRNSLVSSDAWTLTDPDYLIESDGAEWKRIGQDEYARTDGSFPGFTPDRAKIERSSEGLVRAVWGKADRGEPDFLIDRDGSVWHRTDPGRYRYHKNTVLTDSRGWIDDNFGPVIEAWK